jgi:excisionase family DNA binding protein
MQDRKVDSPLMTVHEVAAYLRCSEAAVRLWKREGRLKQVKIGKLVRFHCEDVDAFVRGERQAVA